MCIASRSTGGGSVLSCTHFGCCICCAFAQGLHRGCCNHFLCPVETGVGQKAFESPRGTGQGALTVGPGCVSEPAVCRWLACILGRNVRVSVTSSGQRSVGPRIVRIERRGFRFGQDFWKDFRRAIALLFKCKRLFFRCATALLFKCKRLFFRLPTGMILGCIARVCPGCPVCRKAFEARLTRRMQSAKYLTSV